MTKQDTLEKGEAEASQVADASQSAFFEGALLNALGAASDEDAALGSLVRCAREAFAADDVYYIHSLGGEGEVGFHAGDGAYDQTLGGLTAEATRGVMPGAGRASEIIVKEAPDGRVVWLQTMSRDEHLDVIAVVCAASRAVTDDDRARFRTATTFLGIVSELFGRQRALEAANERFRSLTSSIPGVVYQRVVRPDGEVRYTYISETAYELFGVPADEIINNPQALFNSYAPEYREGFRRRLLEASKNLTKWDVEASIIMPDGSKKYTHAIAKPHREEDGSVLWTGVILDASRIKEAERHAADTEARTREAIVEALGQGFMMFDRTDELVLVNSHYYHLFPALAEVARPGAFYPEVIKREILEVEGEGVSEELLEGRFRERLSAHRGGRDFVSELRLRDDQWLQIDEHRTEDGSCVVIYTDVSEIRQREERIHHMALHDALTGLPNRVFLNQRLQQAFAEAHRYGTGVGVFCMDLDNFKTVNDTLGHPIGDRLLCEAVGRMKANLRGMDTIARLGGDEFAVVMPNIKTIGQVEYVAERLITAIAEPFDFDGQRAVVGASIGVSISGDQPTDPDVALKNADLALYRAKSDGKNCVRIFEPSMDEEAQARRILEVDLRRAIDNQEFELYYQPQVAAGGSKLTGFEALLRWNHPERGLVSPGDFIGLAEETGMVIRIGDWVLETACRTAATWPSHLRVAVNISSVQFKRRDLVNFVRRALKASGLAPERLELEITETVLLRDSEENLQILFGLKALGVRIAMDDFGTGYSSLGNLRSFPFDKIKIDRSFVADLNGNEEASAIVRAIANLGISLGVSTTAEGVETEHQLNHVLRDGCTEIQGYYFGTPVPVDKIAEICKKLG